MSRIDDIIRDAVRDVINSSACDFKNWWKDEFETEVYFETKEDLEKRCLTTILKSLNATGLHGCWTDLCLKHAIVSELNARILIQGTMRLCWRKSTT